MTTFESLTLTPLGLEKTNVQKMLFKCFSGDLSALVESGQICKNNDHTYLFHCINRLLPRAMFKHSALGLLAECSKQLPLDLANVNA